MEVVQDAREPNVSDIDIDVRRFAKLLAKLDEHLPISGATEQADLKKNGRWRSSQREQMSNWFASQPVYQLRPLPR